MEKLAKKEFPMPKKACPEKRRAIIRLREGFILMLKKKMIDD